MSMALWGICLCALKYFLYINMFYAGVHLHVCVCTDILIYEFFIFLISNNL